MKKSELKKYIKEAIIAELMEETTIVGPKTKPTEAPEIAKSEDTDVNTVKAAIDQAKKTGKSINVAEAKKDEDDTEDDEEKLDKKAQAAAKKGGGKVGKLQRVTAQLKELEKEMKELVGKWKKAEGKEKETLLDKLKEKTKVKKELEALEDKLADAIV